MNLRWLFWKVRGSKFDAGSVEECARACEKLAAEFAAENGKIKARAAHQCAERIRALVQ